ncbi:MAG: NAD(P)/FAD-dependent oxidoreductase [Solirubrobacterales bacterium]|nr:NAD(P)/FAD-dependent oxidoreductase [Solirubrobacterales bacterium]
MALSVNGAGSYDVVIIGAGHNGLVAANYLARAGRRVIVLEARDLPGGACTTEELIPGSRWSSCAFVAGLLRPEIIRELELKRFGLELYQGDALGFSLFRDGRHLFMWKELDRTLREIERYSPRDARRFLDFGIRMQRFASLVTPWLLRPAPTRARLLEIFEREGEEELFNEFVLLSTRDLLDRYFESEHIKGFLTFFGMVSVWGGPSTPGTSYVYGHHAWGEFEGQFGQFGFVRGGMGGIANALVAGARHHGAEIRLGAPVAKVLVNDGRAVGVALASGEEIHAGVVLSNADPKRSLLTLVDPHELDDEFLGAVRAIDQRGSMARIHLLIDQLPAYLPFDGPAEGPQHHGHQLLGASVDNFERAWEAQRRGRLVDQPVIEAIIQSTTDPTLASPGQHTLTLGVQQLPFELDGTTWDEAKEAWADGVVDELCAYAPNLKDHILDRRVITPMDLERDYMITAGNIFHAAMGFDQLFGARPLASLASYRTPIQGYYLCGAGTHPGGGVMGASGHNAARAVLSAGTGASSSTPGARPTRVRRGGLLDRVLASERGRDLSYRLARQPALRPLTRLAARTGADGRRD